MIPISQLEHRATYEGYCATGRGPEEMVWDAEKGEFEYERYKFGPMVDYMRHENDSDRSQGEEGFVPLKRKK